MRKRILFCCYGLGIGGIERCMINLLNAMDTEQYEIDVLPMNPEWDLRPGLHANVNLMDPFDYVMNTTDTVDAFRRRHAHPAAYARYVRFRLINKWGSRPWRMFSAPEKTYDIAIAYAHTGYVPFYVMDVVRAERKIMWHHEGRYVVGPRFELDREYFPKWDAIVAVSEDDRLVLKEAFPELTNLRVLHNVLDRDEIRTKACAETGLAAPTNTLILTTVGRLTDQKGPDILLDIAEMLKREELAFRWYWVGDGDRRGFFEEEIEKRGLSEHVIPLGNRLNPYPYMAMCDIYVQPSRYEAYCTTTLEAQVLEKPIVATDVCGMREQFEPGVDGILTEIDAERICEEVLRLARQPGERERLSTNLKKKMQKDDGIMTSYYDFFDELLGA